MSALDSRPVNMEFAVGTVAPGLVSLPVFWFLSVSFIPLISMPIHISLTLCNRTSWQCRQVTHFPKCCHVGRLQTKSWLSFLISTQHTRDSVNPAVLWIQLRLHTSHPYLKMPQIYNLPDWKAAAIVRKVMI
jgi:hypothetical protein